MTVYQASEKQEQLSTCKSQSNSTSGQNTEKGFFLLCSPFKSKEEIYT